MSIFGRGGRTTLKEFKIKIRLFLSLSLQDKCQKLLDNFWEPLSFVLGLIPLSRTKLARLVRFKRIESTYTSVEIENIHYIVNINDHSIARDLFVSRKHMDYAKLELVMEILGLRELELLIDVGANIGTISIPALLNKRTRKVIAFEPHPENIKLLKTNLLLNGVGKQFTVYETAVGAKPNQILTLESSGYNYGDHRIRVDFEDENKSIEQPTTDKYFESSRETLKVNSTNLDKFQNDHCRNSLIWCDVQGFEGFVVAGAKEWIKNKTPFVIEFEPYLIERANSFEILIDSLLSEKGLRIIDLSNPKFELVEPNRDDFCTLMIRYKNSYTDLLVLFGGKS
jgi:FkbM family methyltransferase